eukprot:1147792-Pelagomonas_calceolata.AAC.1
MCGPCIPLFVHCCCIPSSTLLHHCCFSSCFTAAVFHLHIIIAVPHHPHQLFTSPTAVSSIIFAALHQPSTSLQLYPIIHHFTTAASNPSCICACTGCKRRQWTDKAVFEWLADEALRGWRAFSTATPLASPPSPAALGAACACESRGSMAYILCTYAAHVVAHMESACQSCTCGLKLHGPVPVCLCGLILHWPVPALKLHGPARLRLIKHHSSQLMHRSILLVGEMLGEISFLGGG